jgi:hypothetical protein
LASFVANHDAGLDVPLLSAPGEVRRRNQHLGAIDDEALGVQTCEHGGVSRAWVVVELRER